MEVFARRASLCGFLRTVLPNSFAIGSGCSQAAAAPIIPVDILTEGGFALCASWVREPQCAWVHIRCPRSLFHDVSANSLSSVAEQCVVTISNLLKHCKGAACHWTIEAPSRSAFWSTWLGMQLLSSAVDVCLSSFGSSARGCVRFASSAPRCIAGLLPPFPKPALKASSEVVLGRLYRGLAAAMLAFLHVRVTGIPPLQAAQIGTGAQPRKAFLSPVPEFKLFMQVPLQSVPKLDCKNRLKEPFITQGVVVPVGSKLLQPFTAVTSVAGDGGVSNSCHSALSSISAATPSPALASCPASLASFGLGGVALGPRGSSTGANSNTVAGARTWHAVGPDAPKQSSECALASSVMSVGCNEPKQSLECALEPPIQAVGQAVGCVEVPKQSSKCALASSVQAVGCNEPKQSLECALEPPVQAVGQAVGCVEVPKQSSKCALASSVQAVGCVEPKQSPGGAFEPPVHAVGEEVQAVEHQVSMQPSMGTLATPVPGETCVAPRQSHKGALATSVQVVGCEAESLASSPGFSLCAESLLRIFDLLPAEVSARGIQDAREKAWSAGAYVHGTLCGLRRNTRTFPAVVKAAVAWLKAKAPAATFSAIAIYSNVCAPMHRDMNNLKGSLNYVVPLTSFRDGGIWVQSNEGRVVRTTPQGKARGEVLPVCDGAIQFDAHCFHCTLPWVGSRVVLIGFTPAHLNKLKPEERQVLLDLGFPLPGSLPEVSQVVTPECDEPSRKRARQDSGDQDGPQPRVVTFGVPHTESEFVRAAINAGHPRSVVSSLPPHLDSCVDQLARAPPHEVIKKRQRWLGKWTARAAEIGADPDPEWGISDPHMHSVLRQKRLQLLDEIIASEGYEDTNLARDIRAGFDLVGTSPVSNILPGKVSPATLHPDDLRAASARANEALKTTLGSSGCKDQDEKLWDKTMQEVERGWMLGPYDWSDLPEGHIVSHRFPLQQNGKIRPIDDYSRSGVNACVTTLEQPTVDTADVAAAMFAKLCDRLTKAKRSSLIMGRAFDLTAAYRQLCVSLASRQYAVIAVYNPHTQSVALFTQICLPFGSRASVNAFIRCSRCIQWLATTCLLVPTTSYYDDFIVSSPDCLATNTGTTMELLFRLLGWIFDTEGPKADVFSRQVSALGLRFDLSESGEGVVVVDNTCKRKQDIASLVSGILETKTLPYKQGLELRGKLAFAKSQVMGKAGQFALKHLSAHIHAWPFVAKLSEATLQALSFLHLRITEGRPRRITRSLGHPWLVFTDASFEPCFTGGLGGVLISPSGSVRSWFSLPLGEPDIKPLLPNKAETGIGELEAIAVVLALQLWSVHLASCECVLYMDNEGARFSLIKGCSAAWSVTKICHVFAVLCEENTTLPWCARVPSCSNVADHPSRCVGSPLLPGHLEVVTSDVRGKFAELVDSIITLS